MLKLHSVSIVLKEPQSDAIELKSWMTVSDLHCRLAVKFIHVQSMTNLHDTGMLFASLNAYTMANGGLYTEL